ncbi:hypothetical protein BKA66DRAFT_478923 [Pyrenochaeta sp. MPI-SDFR-AT-0127]|nr:hypothetical protein BKA66DRAFT_478923 [Pyrenochaeta sp. MPI-SDFR-AT-0127]
MEAVKQSVTSAVNCFQQAPLTCIALTVAVLISLKVVFWPWLIATKNFWKQHTTNLVFWRGFAGTCIALALCLLFVVTAVCAAFQSRWLDDLLIARFHLALYPPVPTIPPVHCPDARSADCHVPRFYSDTELGLVSAFMYIAVQLEWMRRAKIPGRQMIATWAETERVKTLQTQKLHQQAQRLYADYESDVTMAMHRALQLFAEQSWSRNLPAGHVQRELGYAPLNGSTIMCSLFTALVSSGSAYLEELAGLGLNTSFATLYNATGQTASMATLQWDKTAASAGSCWGKLHLRCNITDTLTGAQHWVRDSFFLLQNAKKTTSELAIRGFNRYFDDEASMLDFLGTQQQVLCAAADAEARKQRDGEHYVASTSWLSGHGDAPLAGFRDADGVWYAGNLIRRPAYLSPGKVDPGFIVVTENGKYPFKYKTGL